ncbi:hypothetical protein ACRALDRAFT_211313 [Sodiomyces alcalophilus JCM 7366]|uniref:uncharacterized protein n=1 Tax=Sodiomyces alcalophilus JCM 7366 TaxID=591952 RepID=UPI0039B5A3E3
MTNGEMQNMTSGHIKHHNEIAFGCIITADRAKQSRVGNENALPDASLTANFSCQLPNSPNTRHRFLGPAGSSAGFTRSTSAERL